MESSRRTSEAIHWPYMLLTLHANSLRSMLVGSRRPQHLSLAELPSFTRQTLGLHGLMIPTTILAGLSREELGRLREQSDRAGCALLSIIEDGTLAIGSATEADALGALERLGRILKAGHTVGCSSIVVQIAAQNTDDGIARAVDRLKSASELAERLEVTILLRSCKGLTSTPEGLTTLIKRVGGFRVGACPDFETAANAPDPSLFMRRLTPYASAAIASTRAFASNISKAAEPAGHEEDPDAAVEHESYPIEPLMKAMIAVGYDGSLAIDYRGDGDATLGVLRSRTLLERCVASVQREEE